MATAFVNNSDYIPIANEAVATIRAARKGVVRAVAIAATVIVTGIVIFTVLAAFGHTPVWVQLALIVVWLGFCTLAATECHDALERLRQLPAYQALQRERARLRFFLGALTARCGGGRALLWQTTDGYAAKAWLARTASGAPAGLRVLVLDGHKLIKYQICRFGAEFIVCQVYNFDTADAAAAAFERSIVDGHSVAEVFGEDNPHILRQLNIILEQLTSQEVIQGAAPRDGHRVTGKPPCNCMGVLSFAVWSAVVSMIPLPL